MSPLRTSLLLSLFATGLPGCLTADDGHPGLNGEGAAAGTSGGGEGNGASPPIGAGGIRRGGGGFTGSAGSAAGGATIGRGGTGAFVGAGGIIGTGGYVGAGGIIGTGGYVGSGGYVGTAGFVGAGGSSGSGGGVAADGGSGDPCALITQPGTAALWCGANIGGSADAQRLYYCSDGVTLVALLCPAGCHASPLGEPDYCIGDDPCVSVPYVNDACGANIGPNADVDTLYHCSNGVTASTTVCTSGCHASPPGQTDYCN